MIIDLKLGECENDIYSYISVLSLVKKVSQFLKAKYREFVATSQAYLFSR